MSVLNIVHVTPTPLVGAPGKIAYAQKMLGHNSIAISLNDYPQKGPLSNLFIDKTILANQFTKPYIEESISNADIIHIHNYLSPNDTLWLKKLNQSAKYVYHVHSPLREGPLYVPRTKRDIIDYDLYLVVGQYCGRFYQDYKPVPNIILSPPTVRLRQKNEKLRIMFSPTHKGSGRWNSKHSPVLNDTLTSLNKLGKIEIIYPSNPQPPEILMDMRRSCHLSIDEIATGAFHMVSLESMCAGNIVINRADFFSKATFASFCNGVMPPFQYADESTISETLFQYAENIELTAYKQQESYNYFKNYCDPIRLVKIINEYYYEII